MATVFSQMGAAKEECIRIVSEAKEFLEKNNRQFVPEDLEKVRLALVGRYNSGKSTIVNALLGERAAETGDAPTTRSAQVYTVKGYEILDLPGTEARAEEAEKARQAMESAHVILYVVASTTGMDQESMWQDLKGIAELGTPFLIVVNDKQPHRDDAAENTFRTTILNHFLELAGHRLPQQDWAGRIFWLNARSAERGRLEGKNRLVERSGIIPFEQALAEMVCKSQPTIQAIDYLRKIQEELKSLTADLESRTDTPELKEAENTLRTCDTVRHKLESMADAVAEENTAHFKDSLSKVLQRAITTKAELGSVEAEIDGLYRTVYENGLSAFLQQCETVQAELAKPSDTTNTLVCRENLAAPKVPLKQIPQSGESGINPAALLGITREALEAITKHPVMSKIPLGKLGPIVVTLAIAAYELVTGIQKAKREREVMELALREAEAKAELAAGLFRQQFLAQARELISQAIRPQEKDAREKLRALSRSNHEMATKIELARSLATRISHILHALSGTVGV